MSYHPPYFAEAEVEDVRELLDYHFDGLGYLWMDRSRQLDLDKNPGYAHSFTGAPVTPLDCIHYLQSYSPGAEALIEEWDTPATQNYVKTVQDPKFISKCLEFDQKGEVLQHIVGLINALYDVKSLQKTYSFPGEGAYLRRHEAE